LQSFFKDWAVIKTEIIAALLQLKFFIQQRFNIPQELFDAMISEQLRLDTGRMFNGIGASVMEFGSGLVTLFIIPVFTFLLLTTRTKLFVSLQLLFPKTGSEEIRNILNRVIHTYILRFYKGMLIVYLVVAILNSIGLWIIGVPHAILFGCIASILTFIPYVGIMVGALLPISVSWITYGSIWYPIGVIAVFGVVQYLEANIKFPYAVGNRLNLNTLVTLIAIFIGGILWGVLGMILFVPFLAIVKLFADQNPKWKAVSNLLSDK
jgi:predicted PurR-regulated permease PerM